jgi:hypothetical protein
MMMSPGIKKDPVRGPFSAGLTALQTCADTIKHVRNNQNHATLFSTGIDLNNQTTWRVGNHDLV